MAPLLSIAPAPVPGSSTSGLDVKEWARMEGVSKEKKSRSGHACAGCRKIKAKCSGSAPCRRCVKNDMECEFLKSKRGNRTKRVKKGATSEEPGEIEDREAAGTAPLPLANPLDNNEEANSTLWSWENFEALPPPPIPLDHSGSPGSKDAATAGSLAPVESLNPLGVLAQASLDIPAFADPASASVDLSQATIAGGTMPSLIRRTANASRLPSELLSQHLITMQEASDLFHIFFTHLHGFLPLLSRSIHTVEATSTRYPFLFTCICATAARHYAKRKDGLYEKAMAIAKKTASEFLLRGWKTLDVVQGFMILCKWHQSEDGEEDMSYQMGGIAVRLAIELNMHQRVTLPDICASDPNLGIELQSQVRQRERTWMMLFIGDRSLSIQMGRPHFISGDDEVIQSARHWMDSTVERAENEHDFNLSAMVELHQIAGHMVASLVTDLKTEDRGLSSLNLTRTLINSFESQLKTWSNIWMKPRPAGSVDVSPYAFYFHYYQVLLFSFGIQRSAAISPGETDHLRYSLSSHNSVLRVIEVAQAWCSRGWLSYATDTNFMAISYVATFLMKFLSPGYNNVLPHDNICSTVEGVIEILRACAVDQRHAPLLYSQFLQLLLERRKQESPSAPPWIGPPTRAASPEPDNLASYVFLLDDQDMGADTAFNMNYPPTMSLESMVDQSMLWSDMLFPGLTGAAPLDLGVLAQHNFE